MNQPAVALRVLHIVHRYPPAIGGAENYMARLSQYLVERGEQVTVYTTTARDLEAFWDARKATFPPGCESREGVTVHRFPLWHAPGIHRYLLKALSLIPIPAWQALTVPFNPIAPGLWQATSRDSPFDLVHAACFPYSFPLVCAARLARRCRIPFLLTPFVHTGDPENPHDRIRRAYTTPALLGIARQADRVFVQTEVERQALEQRGIRAERLILQGLGVDLAGCTGGNRQRLRERLGLGEAVIVGHLGNNSYEKGTIDLLKASQLAWQSGTKFAVVLAGPIMQSFRDFLRTFRPAGLLVQLGELDDEQKRDFFAAIDLFVLPSRSDSFGLVLPEAWANGVPCIGYRAGGIPGVIRDGQDGLLVRCGDLSGLAQAMRSLIEDTDRRHHLGEQGRQRIPMDFDWDAKLELVRATYHQVVRDIRSGVDKATGRA